MEIPFSLEEVVVENIRSGVLVHFEPEEYEYAKKVKEKCREVGIGEFHNNPLELFTSESEDGDNCYGFTTSEEAIDKLINENEGKDIGEFHNNPLELLSESEDEDFLDLPTSKESIETNENEGEVGIGEFHSNPLELLSESEDEDFHEEVLSRSIETYIIGKSILEDKDEDIGEFKKNTLKRIDQVQESESEDDQSLLGTSVNEDVGQIQESESEDDQSLLGTSVNEDVGKIVINETILENSQEVEISLTEHTKNNSESMENTTDKIAIPCEVDANKKEKINILESQLEVAQNQIEILKSQIQTLQSEQDSNGQAKDQEKVPENNNQEPTKPVPAPRRPKPKPRIAKNSQTTWTSNSLVDSNKKSTMVDPNGAIKNFEEELAEKNKAKEEFANTSTLNMSTIPTLQDLLGLNIEDIESADDFLNHVPSDEVEITNETNHSITIDKGTHENVENFNHNNSDQNLNDHNNSDQNLNDFDISVSAQSDVHEKSSIMELSDSEFELFKYSKTFLERAPVTEKIIKHMISYNQQGKFDELANLENNINPFLMTEFKQDDEANEETFLDEKAQNVADAFFPNEKYLVIYVAPDGNCFARACTKATTNSVDKR